MTSDPPVPTRRQARHAVLVRADTAALEAAWAPYAPRVTLTPLRPPEAGMVMLRGRIGGNGAPFNLGEATVCRCALEVRLADDENSALGVAYVLGRDRRKAELVAAFDGVAQLPRLAAEVAAQVIGPLAAAWRARSAQAAAAADASRVAFYTLVRGES